MVGIDDLSFYVPRQYLDLKDMAQQRGIEYEKLSKGLGVLKSAVPASNEDAASMAANAALRLIQQNGLHPSEIGRIYVGTESAIDGAKPVASYVLGMLEEYFTAAYGPGNMRHCDAVDMTFACIGATDALLSTVDWCLAGEQRKGIVIATDYAKYELESTGEYTQGAGAVAALVSRNPRLVAIHPEQTGVACKGDHDFYKPVRKYNKAEVISKLLENLGIDPSTVDTQKITEARIDDIFTAGEQEITFFKSTPLFDGQYSNQCYADRLREAYTDHVSKGGTSLNIWTKAVFHLPYAFHGKRIFHELFFLENKSQPAFIEELYAQEPAFDTLPYAQQLKTVSQSASYKAYVNSHMEKGARASSEIGNIYTASVFMALLSELELSARAGEDLNGKKIGFCAYGSGSKAKVFTGTVQPGWTGVVNKWELFNDLENRTAMSFEAYQARHNAEVTQNGTHSGFYLVEVQPGSFIRTYAYMEMPAENRRVTEVAAAAR